ncbi:serine hydrolase domain-containing protein [Microbulbifer sp. S227A]|uniref:serine hydrolase domain-containing protein n=1 Tax=Microbulbifer sp. S227A TaxID=3415131 RepID=UPI003C7E17C4
MRTLGKWLGRILLSLILAAVVIGVWKREEILRLWAVNSLFAEDRIVGNFSNMDAAFLTAPLPRGNGPVSPLPIGDPAPLPAGIGDWIDQRAVTSLLVMKDGEIRHEDYFLGTGPDDRRISWSIAKSYLSALFGILLDEGTIASLDDPVTRYAPLLTGTAYDGATLRNVLNMASGVIFDEDYHDPNSDINRMGRVIALGGTLDDFTASFSERFSDPGQVWKYVSIDTHVIGMVIRGATGRSVSELLAEKIIAPLGQEQDAYYLTDGAGVAFVLGGLNITTRDYARFAQMILQNGTYNGQQIVPAGWIAASTAATAPTEPGRTAYGYQWWIPAKARPGEFLGRGVYGQYLYIDQTRKVVIVATAADRAFREPGVNDGNIAMFRQIADGL